MDCVCFWCSGTVTVSTELWLRGPRRSGASAFYSLYHSVLLLFGILIIQGRPIGVTAVKGRRVVVVQCIVRIIQSESANGRPSGAWSIVVSFDVRHWLTSARYQCVVCYPSSITSEGNWKKCKYENPLSNGIRVLKKLGDLVCPRHGNSYWPNTIFVIPFSQLFSHFQSIIFLFLPTPSFSWRYVRDSTDRPTDHRSQNSPRLASPPFATATENEPFKVWARKI